MKNRKKLRYVIIVLAAVCVVGTGTAAYRADFKLGQNVELIVNMMRGIFMYYVDEVDPDMLGKNATAGMVAGLDPYTELIHADDSEQWESMIMGKYGGIGAVIRQRGDLVQIAEPYEGSPADRAGLEIGDTFLRIDGKDTRGMTTAQVSALLKGEAGTDITVEVRKFHTGEEETITLRREVISLPAVPYYTMLADSIGYIRHSEFTDGSADEVRSAFTELKSRGAKSLILDYRSNGGGLMQEAVKIIAMFVPKGTEAVSMRGRNESTNKQYFTETEPLDTEIPIAVLTDGYSASASEIVAGAMQDLDRGVIVGQRTFGKGLVQNTLPMGYGSWLKITTAKYYIPSGRCIQAIDYSRSTDADSNGSAASAENGRRLIPDSLISEFHTTAGRKVYDGGGVMPDVRLEAQYSSRFTVVAYSDGSVDEFTDKWILANREREVVPGEFALTDEDYARFVEFMRDRDLDYESATGQTLDALRGNAEQERYMTDELRIRLDEIEAAIKDDTETNLALYRDELSNLIEEGIMLRRGYSRAVAKHRIRDDETIDKAIEVLGNKALYREILTSRDTDRK